MSMAITDSPAGWVPLQNKQSDGWTPLPKGGDSEGWAPLPKVADGAAPTPKKWTAQPTRFAYQEYYTHPDFPGTYEPDKDSSMQVRGYREIESSQKLAGRDKPNYVVNPEYTPAMHEQEVRKSIISSINEMNKVNPNAVQEDLTNPVYTQRQSDLQHLPLAELQKEHARAWEQYHATIDPKTQNAIRWGMNLNEPVERLQGESDASYAGRQAYMAQARQQVEDAARQYAAANPRGIGENAAMQALHGFSDWMGKVSGIRNRTNEAMANAGIRKAGQAEPSYTPTPKELAMMQDALERAYNEQNPITGAISHMGGNLVSPQSIAAMIAAGPLGKIGQMGGEGLAGAKALQLTPEAAQAIARAGQTTAHASGFMGTQQTLEQAANGEPITLAKNYGQGAAFGAAGELGGELGGALARSAGAGKVGQAIGRAAGATTSAGAFSVGQNAVETGRLPTLAEAAQQAAIGAAPVLPGEAMGVLGAARQQRAEVPTEQKAAATIARSFPGMTDEQVHEAARILADHLDATLPKEQENAPEQPSGRNGIRDANIGGIQGRGAENASVETLPNNELAPRVGTEKSGQNGGKETQANEQVNESATATPESPQEHTPAFVTPPKEAAAPPEQAGKETPSPEPQGGAKEPWRMTKDEFTGDLKQDSRWTPEIQSSFERMHKNSVEGAILSGKPVPPEVLKDYPDLAAKTPPESQGWVKLESAKEDVLNSAQQYRDAIETKRSKGEKVPTEWINKLAELESGSKVSAGEVAGLKVFGHPEATNIGGYKYSNLVPIKASNVESINKRMESTQRLIDQLSSRIMKRKGVKPLSVEEETILDLLKNETMPELARISRELSKEPANVPAKEVPPTAANRGTGKGVGEQAAETATAQEQRGAKLEGQGQGVKKELPILYHGTQAKDEFSQFRPTSHGKYGEHGFYYFSDKPNVLQKMIKAGASSNANPVTRTIKATVDVKKPLDLTAYEDSRTPAEWAKLLESKGIKMPQVELDRIARSPSRIEVPVWNMFRHDSGPMRQALIDAGFDGIKWGEWGGTTTVAVHPEQIQIQKGRAKKAAKEAVQVETPKATEGPAADQAVGAASGRSKEFEEPNPTSIKNAQVDKEREARGLPPAMQPARRAFGEVWDSAMREVTSNPKVTDELIDHLRDHPRALTDREDAILLQRQIDLQNQYRAVVDEINVAKPDDDNLPSLRTRLAGLSDQLLDIYNINKSSGTETGRGLNARKMMANEGYGLVEMETARRAAKGGKKLTAEEAAETKKLSAAIQETQERLETHEQKQATKRVKTAADAVAEEESRDVKKNVKSPKQRRETALSKLKDSADNPEALGRWIREVFKTHVAADIAANEPRNEVNREKNLTYTYSDVVKELPDITRREVQDAISGYGKFRQLSKEELDVRTRQYSGELREAAKLEDVLKKQEAPKKTGMERQEPTDEERRITKQVRDAMKRLGITSVDPETQLKTALETKKTSLRNQIADLEYQIATRQKIVKSEGASPQDAETLALEGLRDKLRADFNEIFGKPELTDEQRIDRAIKATQRQVEEYEQKVKDREIGKSVKPAKLHTPELDALRARRDAAREQLQLLRDVVGQESKETAQMQAIQKKIEEINQKIAKGDTSQPEKQESTDSPELAALKRQRDLAQKTLDGLRREANKTPQSTIDARKEAARIKALEDSIAKLSNRIAEKDTATNKTEKPPESPQIEALKKQRDLLQKTLGKLRAEANPKKSKEEIALQAFKTRTQNRMAELLGRIRDQNFDPVRPKNPIVLDTEGIKLKSDAERVKQQWQDLLARERLKNRSTMEKVADAFSKWNRASILSGYSVIEKLTGAASLRALTSPVEEAVGAGLSKVPGISSVAKRAPREGGASIKAEAKALTEGVTRGMVDAWKKLRTGKSDLDTLYGKHQAVPDTALDFFGHLHGALKAPVQRAEFARSFEKRTEAAIRAGLDVHDPLVQTRIGQEAYRDGQRAIFMQDSRVAGAVQSAIMRLEAKDKATGEVPGHAKALATVARTALPIVKIPTNIVAEAMNYSLGLLPGGYKLARAYAKGIENLKPEQADSIMRHLKKGSIGSAVMLLGYLGANSIGGYYQQGQKRKEDEVQPGDIKVFGVNIPHTLLHNPLMDTLQIGATIRRVADSKARKKDDDTQGVGAGSVAAAVGLLESVPLVKESEEVAQIMDPRSRDRSIGQTIKSIAVPQIVQQTASAMDSEKRKPTGIVENIKVGIPGLRQTVPTEAEAAEAAKTPRQRAVEALAKERLPAKLGKEAEAVNDKMRKAIANGVISQDDANKIWRAAASGYTSLDAYDFATETYDSALNKLEKMTPEQRNAKLDNNDTYITSLEKRLKSQEAVKRHTASELKELRDRLAQLKG